MAQRTKRNVRRSSTSGRQGLVGNYGQRRWYEIPDWAKAWVVDNAGWVMLVVAIILFPPTLLALVLGVYNLPFLGFLGIPSSANGFGLAAFALITKFILAASAVRPLFRKQAKGWYLLIASASVHLIHSVILQHAVTGTALFILTLYLYMMVRRRYRS